MKIVSWNANGKFREKHKAILELDADIYVIQECENPEYCKDSEYRAFIKNYHWAGRATSFRYSQSLFCLQ